MGKNSVQKVSQGWKKRVKIEYDRLRHQKKFRHQDDIRKGWRTNRVAMQAANIKKESEQDKPIENEAKEVIGVRAKPIWVCSEVSIQFQIFIVFIDFPNCAKIYQSLFWHEEVLIVNFYCQS